MLHSFVRWPGPSPWNAGVPRWIPCGCWRSASTSRRGFSNRRGMPLVPASCIDGLPSPRAGKAPSLCGGLPSVRRHWGAPNKGRESVLRGDLVLHLRNDWHWSEPGDGWRGQPVSGGDLARLSERRVTGKYPCPVHWTAMATESGRRGCPSRKRCWVCSGIARWWAERTAFGALFSDCCSLTFSGCRCRACFRWRAWMLPWTTGRGTLQAPARGCWQRGSRTCRRATEQRSCVRAFVFGAVRFVA